MIPSDISSSTLKSALDGVKLAYFDVRLHETALIIAHEVSVVVSNLHETAISRHIIVRNQLCLLLYNYKLEINDPC